MDETVQHDTAASLVKQQSLTEAMIISTCNRLEVYTVATAFHSGVEDVLGVLAEVSGVSEAELRGYLYVRCLLYTSDAADE